MKLTLLGHEELYAIEQLQMALFPAATISDRGQAVSRLYRGKQWLTAVTVVELDGKTTRGIKRLAAEKETVSARRKCLQQSYYLAALPHLPQKPQWGALSGVRPTKLTTRHLLAGGTTASARKMMEKEYFVSPERAALAAACSEATVDAMGKLEENHISLYIGIPFCPTRCAYCSFVS